MTETKPANVLYHTLLYCALVKVDWASVAFLGHADQGRMWKLISLKTEKNFELVALLEEHRPISTPYWGDFCWAAP